MNGFATNKVFKNKSRPSRGKTTIYNQGWGPKSQNKGCNPNVHMLRRRGWKSPNVCALKGKMRNHEITFLFIVISPMRYGLSLIDYVKCNNGLEITQRR